MSVKARPLSRLVALAATLVAFATPVFAQAGRATLTGIVKDVATGAPVVGVTVKIPGLGAAASTRDDGRYSIPNLPLGATVSIEATRVGYGPTRIDNVKLDLATTERNITINAAATSLEAVTSSATTDPTSGVKIPFAMARLDADQMPVPNLSNAAASIQGKVAGAVVTAMSGQPGDSSAVVLRAILSPFHNISPLYVVDGVPLSNTNFTSGDFMGLDIESVEVIKGAAAASLYGSRASGGVIAITTKRGKDIALGTSQLEFRQDYGFEDISMYPPRKQAHYFNVNDQLQWTNSLGIVVTKSARISDPNAFQDNQYALMFDPVAQVMSRNTSMVSRVSISQASATTNLNLSYTRNRTPGIVKFNEGQTQQNVRFFITHQLRDNLSVETSAQHTRSIRDDAATSFSQLFSWDPDVNLLRANLDPAFEFPYIISPDSVASTLNPLYSEWRNDNFSKRMRSLVTADVQYRPFNWVTVRASLGYDKSNNTDDQFQAPGLPDGGTSVTNGSLLYREASTDALSGDILGTVLRDLGRLTTKLTVKGHIEREDALTFRSSGTSLSTGFRTLSNAVNKTTTSNVAQRRINSASANIGADYGGRYIFDGLILHEGNSRFGPENRYNDYFRLAGSWLLSEESWYPSFLSKLTLSKLRYSYGTAGNQPDFTDQYENIQVSAFGAGFIRDELGNPALKPEMKYDHEFGADFIWNNKVSFQFTYARSTVKDALVGNAAPSISGYNTVQDNIGVTRGETYEGTIEGTWITKRIGNKNFRWWSNLVASRNQSTLVDLGRPCYFNAQYHYTCDGVPPTSIWGFTIMRSFESLTEKAPSFGQYANQFEINDEGYLVPVGVGNHWWEGTSKNLWGTKVTLPVGTGTGVAPRILDWGTPQTQFIDTTGGINLRWQHEVGNSQQLLDFGVGNRFNYGNFSAYIHFRGAIGGDIWNNYKWSVMNSRDDPAVDQTGKPDSLKKPQFYFSAASDFAGLAISNNGYAYTPFVKQNNWAKLGELALTYSMNSTSYKFLNRMGAERVNISLSGRDLYTFMGGYDGMDPEAFVNIGNTTGAFIRLDQFRYPPTRKYSGTVTVVF